MKRLVDFLKSRFKNRPPTETADVDGLRIAFKERYHHFKLLLNANNTALEIMTTLEQALQGKQPFGMSFIRGNCIELTVCLMRLLKSLEQLSGGKYNSLYDRFDEIWNSISAVIEQKQIPADARLIIPLSAVDRSMADLVGNKMANLGEVRNKVEMRVPAGFAITARAYQYFIEYNDLQTEIDSRFIAADITDMEALYALSIEIQSLITKARIPENLESEIMKACHQLERETGGPAAMALRSSALGEDAAGDSFAGQYRTELNVSTDDLIEKYKTVVASKYSITALTYRINKGIRDESLAMSVGCLAMVDARSGGVMYTRNPLDTGDNSVFINSAWGLPKAVVDGNVDCDLFVIKRTPPMAITFRDIKEKNSQFLCSVEKGVCQIEVTGDINGLPSIGDEEARMLSGLAVRLEGYYGSPLDIEWAVSRDDLVYILQCRPLQQAEALVMNYPEALRQKTAEDALASGGTVIYPGLVGGEVFIVNNADDMVRFPEGGILVARQALPLWASLLNRAAAVLTEHGTFAGHLANVSREFKVPAIFGLPGITGRLKNGEMVTVDTGRSSVYRGFSAVTAPVEASAFNRRIKGSPVYKLLEQVSALIIPLNLLDPYSPDFKPENCRTFHDITRFAHEKSVQEMFNFGKDHNFSERSSKQLFYKVPMQWWILKNPK